MAAKAGYTNYVQGIPFAAQLEPISAPVITEGTLFGLAARTSIIDFKKISVNGFTLNLSAERSLFPVVKGKTICNEETDTFLIRSLDGQRVLEKVAADGIEAYISTVFKRASIVT